MAKPIHGLWWEPSRPDARVAGLLERTALKAPVLDLLEAPPAMWMEARDGSYRGDHHTVVPMLHGKTPEGAFTLLGGYWWGGRMGVVRTQQLRCDTVLHGLWLDRPDERCFRRVEMVIPPLETLFDRYPIRLSKRPAKQAKSMVLKVNRQRRCWDDAETRIEFEFIWTINESTSSYNISMAPTISFSSARPRSIQHWTREWLVPFNNLVAVLAGVKANPTTLQAWIKRAPRMRERSEKRARVFSQGVGEHDYIAIERPVMAMLDEVADAGGGLHSAVRLLREIGTEQQVFFELLSDSIRDSDRPQRNRYLDLTAALEAYHYKEVGVAPIQHDSFRQRRQEAVDSLKAHNVPSRQRRFIGSWLARRSSYSLEERLAQLAETAGVRDSWQVSPKGMAAMRNDIAHGNASPDWMELERCYDQAFDLARRLILVRLEGA